MFRAILNCTNVTGRASRSEYWMFVLLQTLIALVFGVLHQVFAVTSPTSAITVTDPAADMIIGRVQNLVYLALIVPGLTVIIRRLHDTNRSGWWLLLSVPGQVGLVFLLFGGLALAYSATLHQSVLGSGLPAGAAAFIVFGLVCIACAVTLFVFMCLKGTSGPNRFGPDPLDPESVPEADVFDGGPDMPSPPPAPMRVSPVPAAPVYAPASPLHSTRTFGKRR